MPFREVSSFSLAIDQHSWSLHCSKFTLPTNHRWHHKIISGLKLTKRNFQCLSSCLFASFWKKYIIHWLKKYFRNPIAVDIWQYFCGRPCFSFIKKCHGTQTINHNFNPHCNIIFEIWILYLLYSNVHLDNITLVSYTLWYLYYLILFN